MKRRAIFGLLLLVAFAALAWRAARSMQRELAVTEVCDAAAQRRWDEALAPRASLDGGDDAAHAALECRCLALIMKGDRPHCLEELERALAADREWIPDPLLAAMLVEDWLARGDPQRALALAVDTAKAHPEDPAILAREIDARAATHDVRAAFDAVEPRIGGDAAPALRFAAAERAIHFELPERALSLLGPAPLRAAGRESEAWYLMRTDALGALGRTDDMKATMEQWRAAGAPEALTLAHLAILRHKHQLWNASPMIHELIGQALERKSDLPDRLVRDLYARRIGALATSAGTRPQALALLREARAYDPDFPLDERDVQMSDQGSLESAGEADGPRGELSFTAPPGIDGVLRLAPDASEPIDNLHEELPVARGATLTVERSVGRWPVRWVFVDDGGATRASGTTWPVEGRAVSVIMEARAPSPPSSLVLAQPPADGRRRVFLVVLDSADWRVATYLMARGELPFLLHMHQQGLHAVLDSYPAFTAAAMKALTRPDEPRLLTVPIALHGLGEQLTTFFQLGENPVSALSLVVPNEPDLFHVLGQQDLVVANMLHGHGGLNAGVHGATFGPKGKKGAPLNLSVGRALRDDERARFKGLVDPPQSFLNEEVKDTAAQFDDAVALAREGRVDLLLLRVPATDHSAHATFMTASRGGQDDGQHFLYDLYRYCDARLSELFSTLDGDDVLIVMSDHGLSSHMAHDRRSMFLVAGGAVPKGRSKAIVPLFGLPRTLADLLGVPTEWGKSGLEGWIKHIEENPTPPTK